MLYLGFPFDIWQMIICYFPGAIGVVLRYRFWKKRLKFVGRDVRIDPGVYFQNPTYISIDDHSWIDRNVMILAGLDPSSREKVHRKNKNYQGDPGIVHIGKNVHIGPSCIISGISAGVFIDDNCGLAAGCKVYAFSHHYRSKKNPHDPNVCFTPRVDHSKQCLIEGPIHIGRNTGIALNAVVLPGVSLLENSFVGINSVVSARTYKANSILAGNPAKEVGERFIF